MTDPAPFGASAPEGAEPSIAVVVMAYNRPGMIAQAIDSLLAQRRPVSSIAAVYLADDRSTDQTVQVARDRWKSGVPLTLLQPERNAGTWGNVNHALEALADRHEWVLLLHDDDIVKPEWLGAMCDRIRTCADSTLSICSSWDSLHPDGATVPGENDPARPSVTVAGDEAGVRGTLMRGCWWHFSGCAIRTRAFLDVGRFDPRYLQCADQDWLMRGLDRGWSVDYLPRTLLIYREHQASLSSRSFMVHQDLVEQLLFVERFGRLLSRAEALRFHLRLLQFAGRRAARAIVRLHPTVLVNAVKLMPQCVLSWARTLRTPPHGTSPLARDSPRQVAKGEGHVHIDRHARE